MILPPAHPTRPSMPAAIKAALRQSPPPLPIWEPTPQETVTVRPEVRK